QEGIAMSQATIAGGRRMSTAHCYLDPVRNRQNLHIETEALTERLVLDGKRCTSVRYSLAGEVREARAGGAVVVSAGAFNSPQLLELSGIGQPERLCNLGIEVRHELPGVGENLRDHYVPRTRWLVGKKGITFNDRGRGVGLAHQVLRYVLSRQGMLAMTGAPLRAFVCSREGLEAPDLMLGWIPMLIEPSPKGPRISRQSGLTLYAHPMRPESKGHVHITVADARRPPAINFNFLSSPPDAELTVRAVRVAREIMTAPAMTPFQMSEVAPGANRTSDEEILDWVKQAAETTYHPVGTCKMGSDPMAVVDTRLRVHGLAGLRVADASIMPTLTSGNTNAPSIMIGEKVADMVLNAAT
ncbi:MAG TPA: GMC oxidoreductase, partial [Stellaceae bacterium]|nr:GMC oxidoreductase [Stellaceae bacterium]